MPARETLPKKHETLVSVADARTIGPHSFLPQTIWLVSKYHMVFSHKPCSRHFSSIWSPVVRCAQDLTLVSHIVRESPYFRNLVNNYLLQVPEQQNVAQ